MPLAKSRLTPPLKWHGGKTYLAKRIIELMPSHVHYVEPFAGGLAVLLAKDPDGVSEVVNDLNGRLTNFWSVLKDPNQFARFQRVVAATPFSEKEWSEAHESRFPDDPIADAIAFFIDCRMSLAGRQNSFASITRRRTRRNMNEQASAWLGAVDGLAEVHRRLRRVVILNRPAAQVITTQDGPDTLFYLDPPYVAHTRTHTETYGDFEMNESDHRELLKTICAAEGKVLLSGYPSDLYESALRRWKRLDFELPNNAASGASKRRMTEVVWMNF